MDIKAKIELRNLIEHYGIDEIKEALKEIELEYRPLIEHYGIDEIKEALKEIELEYRPQQEV